MLIATFSLFFIALLCLSSYPHSTLRSSDFSRDAQ